jgi:hypothetical protein
MISATDTEPIQSRDNLIYCLPCPQRPEVNSAHSPLWMPLVYLKDLIINARSLYFGEEVQVLSAGMQPESEKVGEKENVTRGEI